MNVTLVLFALLAVDDPSLPAQARDVLVKHCGECHGPAGSEKDWGDFATDLSELTQRKRAIAGKPEASRIVVRMSDPVAASRMPPTDAANPRVAAGDLDIVKRWIAAGAKPLSESNVAVEPDRVLRGFDYVIAKVHRHLKQLDPADRSYQRYFLLINLHNQPPANVKQADLRTARAGLSKALNSLSWRQAMVLPAAIDEDQTIFSIDLRDLEWEPNSPTGRVDFWRHLASRYPYGLKHDSYPESRQTRDQWNEIDQWTGTSIPWIRADWFVTNATQPPLYHELLYDFALPELAKRELVTVELADKRKVKERRMNAVDLENAVRVDVARNLRMFRAIRSGDSDSDVSTGPRVLERHGSAYGAYWKSYDFRAGTNAGLIQQQPLGPPGSFRGGERHEFRHDGGEIVFHLPNGLQGYLLVNGKGDRIAYGPDDLVGDKSRTLGSFQIVNGISCMSCHVDGMKTEHTVDKVRTGILGLPPDVRDLVRRIYVDPVDFSRKLEEDKQRFLQAMHQSTHAFRANNETGEPIRAVSFRHAAVSLGLIEVAADLGESPERLKVAIENNADLQRLGLTTLVGGGTIKRNAWEDQGPDSDGDGFGDGNSLFQRTAQARRNIGTPVKTR